MDQFWGVVHYNKFLPTPSRFLLYVHTSTDDSMGKKYADVNAIFVPDLYYLWRRTMRESLHVFHWPTVRNRRARFPYYWFSFHTPLCRRRRRHRPITITCVQSATIASTGNTFVCLVTFGKIFLLDVSTRFFFAVSSTKFS